MPTTQSRVKNKSICPTNISLSKSCIEHLLTHQHGELLYITQITFFKQELNSKKKNPQKKLIKINKSRY